MSYYTQRLKPAIMTLIEEGEHTIGEIARMYNVSVAFVSEVKRGMERYI